MEYIQKFCSYPSCGMKAINRCSSCHLSHYCNRDHQKLDWPSHKITCATKVKDINKNGKHNNEIKSNKVDDIQESVEKRQCRCMFCGESLVFSSEDEAIQHMSENNCSVDAGQTDM